MNYRFMRLIVFFDLPMETDKERIDYNHFRKFLLKNGFIMMQKSVYSKLVLNGTTSISIKNSVKKNLPPKGLIQLLEITEKQFSEVEYLRGSAQKLVLDSDERLIEI